MAARVKCKLLTFGSSATTLKAALDNVNDDFVGSVTLRAGPTNAGTVYWGDGTSNGGYLEPKEAVSFDLTGKFVYAGSISLLGTAGDTLYITVIG